MKQDNINYFAVGLLVLAMITLLIVTLINVGNRAGSTAPYYVHFTNVTDIYEGTAVTFGGYQIGSVEEITPRRDSGGLYFRLKLAIAEDWKLPSDSIAQITAPGLLSDNQIDISEGSSTTMLSPGDRIADDEAAGVMASLDSVSAEITDLSRNNLKPLLINLDRYVTSIGEDLSEKLPMLTESLTALVDRINQSTSRLDLLVNEENARHVSNVLANADDTSANLRSLAQDLNQTNKQLGTILGNANDLVTSNQVDIRESVVDLRRTMAVVSQSVESIMFHLENASRNADEFTRQLRNNPSVIISSKPPVDQGNP